MPAPWSSFDVALVTASAFPECLPDERLLMDALAARGVKAGPVIWDDASVDWSHFRLALIRTAWDSDKRRDEFVAWAGRAGARCPLWNPPEVLRWNTHKGYLRELEARGVAVVPTAWLERGATVDVKALLAGRGWSDAVVKPAVSAGARDTLRVRGPGDIPAAQALVERVLPHKDMMVQPYQSSVEGYGERSLLFLGGEHTHAIKRQPALSGDPDYDATAAEPAPSAEDERAFARQVIAATGFELLYARVDVARDEAGGLRLMELEITEPNLFLRQGGPRAVERLADALVLKARAR
ncbi:RimK family alpha-L-glutamate ligase [Archangium sp.]|uniref:ATP-grasp domain-containing protein n=1 Tax=Archangium sp. TaxID=1872627 RepID=UPI00389A1462